MTLPAHQLSMTVLMTPDMANFSGNVHGGAILKLLDQVAYACGARYAGCYVVTLSVPPRQNSCRLSMMLNLGATRMRDGSVRRSIQEQSGGAVVAAGERPSGRGITRDWGFGADIGTMA